jgi:hypothetical protein
LIHDDLVVGNPWQVIVMPPEVRISKSRLIFAALILFLVLSAGPAWGDPPCACVSPPCQGVIFALNGSGTLQVTSSALERAVADACLPLSVVTFEWSQGRVIADHTDWCHAQEEGRCLAVKIASYHQAHPSTPIYLVAHSAGTGVALVATACAPPGSVTRVILLAPAVSCGYDLRPALRVATDGIDVFYSRRDVFSLGFGVAFVGTSDGRRGYAAGRVGFRAEAETPEDEVLYAKLRQYPWERSQRRAGNPGFHSGALRQRFLQAEVLPLLNSNPKSEFRISKQFQD